MDIAANIVVRDVLVLVEEIVLELVIKHAQVDARVHVAVSVHDNVVLVAPTT